MLAQPKDNNNKTVERRRAFFEHLYGCDQPTQKKKPTDKKECSLLRQRTSSSQNNAVLSSSAPAKPQRTFAHDIYMETKAVIGQDNGHSLSRDRNAKFPAKNVYSLPLKSSSSRQPIRPPYPENAHSTSGRSVIATIQPTITARRNDQANNNASAWRPPVPPKPPHSPVHLKGKPRFFQLSHEYEPVNYDNSRRTRRTNENDNMRGNGDGENVTDTAVASVQHPTISMKRSTSDHVLYATPSSSAFDRRMHAPPIPVHVDQVYDTVADSLYYATTEINGARVQSKCDAVGSAVQKNPASATVTPKNAIRRSKHVETRRGSGCSLKQSKRHPDTGEYAVVNRLQTEADADDYFLRRLSATSDEESSTATGQKVIKRQTSSPDSTQKRRINRARLVHRRTLAFYDQQAEAFCRRKAAQLFESALVVKLGGGARKKTVDSNAVDHDPDSAGSSSRPASNQLPIIAYRFPPEKAASGRRNTGSSTAVQCPALFYPDFSRATPYSLNDHWPGDEEFVVILTNEQGERKFAYCIRYLPREREYGESDDERLADEPPTSHCRNRSDSGLGSCSNSAEVRSTLPEVLVIISPIQAPAFYLALAREAVLCARQSLRRQLTRFLSAIFWKPFPNAPGSSLVIQEIGRTYEFGRETKISNFGSKSGRAGTAALVARMGVEQVVSVLVALLAEQRVLIAGEAVSSVSQAVQTLTGLLQPLSWPHTLVPVVPDSLLDLCHLPTPYCIGILRSNLDSLKELLIDETNSNNNVCDIPLQQDLIFTDIDYGVLVPRPAAMRRAMYVNRSWHEHNAFTLCEGLGVPRKLVAELMRALRAAISHDISAAADAVISWFASLLGHYHHCISHSSGRPAEFNAERFRDAHTSKSARSFLEWFTATGIFQDWIRRRMEHLRNSNGSTTKNVNGWLEAEHTANRRLDELAVNLAPGAAVPNDGLLNGSSSIPGKTHKIGNFVQRLLRAKRK